MIQSNSYKLVACLICCTLMIGCGLPQKQTAADVVSTETILPFTPIPATSTPQPTQILPVPEAQTPQPTQIPEEELQKNAQLLDALDLAVFCDFVTSDGYTLQRSLIDPQEYGIEVTEELFTWGALASETAANYAQKASELLENLLKIERSYLSDQDQLLFDTLEQYLKSIIDLAPLSIYSEPLEPGAGLQVQVPLMLSLFRLKTVEDITNYFSLLQDIPRLFEEILEQQRHRAEAGLFMTQSALHEVLHDCSMIIDNEKSLYLKTSFSETLADMEGISKAQRNAYIAQHNEAIQNSLIPAYKTLQSGLQELASSCREEQGIYSFGEDAMRYYSLQLSQQAASDIMPEDALTLLETAMTDLLATMQAIYADEPSVADYGSLSKKATPAKLLEELQEQTENLLPQLPEEVTVTVTKIPDSMDSILSSAQFVIPPIDGENAYQILLNEKTKDNTLLLTLAHEAYPGHLYQFAYQRNLTTLGLLPQVLSLPGYIEGWAQMAEEWMLLDQTKYDQNAAMFAFCSSMLSDALLPSIISIYVNYYGYETDDVRNYLAQYGLQEESYVTLYFDQAVNHPYSKLRYGIGYAQLAEMMRDMSAILGENYLQHEVLERYLNFGPSYFNLIQERMDEWADAKVLE